MRSRDRLVTRVAALGLTLACALPACAPSEQSQSGALFEARPVPPMEVSPYEDSFTAFESGQVRPLALTPNKKLLLATNTPDARLEIFKIVPSGLVPVGSVPVGLEPVAVAVRGDDEAWVVNHLSDSVSVVRIDGKHSRVLRTLHVGDEPRDIVFGGPGRSRAFITTAHRGQNAPYDPELTTPGVGRADVWVFDAAALSQDSSLGGTPLGILTLFSDTPRALAVSPDGARVYAAAFASGNRTTTLSPDATTTNSYPGPGTNAEGEAHPVLPLILKHDGQHWVDELGQNYDSAIEFNLPDKDVFVIDAMATPPRQLEGSAGSFSGVGTVLFNLVVNPVSGKVYASNLESNNAERFEGNGDFAGRSLRGHLAESRITVLDPAQGARPRHLNKHIDYSQCCAPLPNDENAKSLAFPLQIGRAHV